MVKATSGRIRIITAMALLGLMVIFVLGPSYGQDKRHEFSVGYGMITSSQIVDIFTNVLLITITIGQASKVDNKYPGAIVLNYKYSGRSRLAFGFTLAIDRASGNLAMASTPVGTYSENYYTGAVELDYRFINRKNFCLYSGLGLGLTIRKGEYRYSDTETSSNALPAVNVTLLGFRVGDKIALFGELGGGYKGILHGGVRFSL
ncbi:MAG: hypothetical protein QHH43_05390 [Candidatus Saccharicenans sp.]|nr:hypothetical protein [Candidatus Saccharicenans sp.]MDH7575175.1 hypothetical protein [Candidatus Saccharicenans sp.]